MKRITMHITIILAAGLYFSGAAAQDHVVINEVMSSNTRWNYDSDFGAFSDWIELHNPTGAAIDLAGWYLTDDPDNPDKWEIPENAVIPAGGYLLFWADDRDLVPGQTALVEFTEVHEITVQGYHLNFRINRDREELMLLDAGQVVVDQLSLRDQERDITYGRQPGDPDRLVFLGEPTPMAENSMYYTTSLSRSDRPMFSLPGGMYQETLEVALSSPAAGTTIRYTTDGSEPSTASPVYTAPLPVFFSQVIKARVYETGKLPGEVATVSYIIGEDTNLPVLSVSTEHKNLWGFDFGLYQNNYKNREVFAHLEYFGASGDEAFAINAGLQLFGSQIFLFDQKPFSVFFRNRYGQDSLVYPLFPDKAISVFHSIVLRNGGNDNGLTMFRDGLGAALIEQQVDIDHQSYRPVVLYMNGEYWGIFNIREKLNEEYLQENHRVNPDYVDILEDSLEVNNGDANRYRELLDFAANNDLRIASNYDRVAGWIDLDELINYMGYKIWGGYKQWQVNNKYWRERLPGGTWRWIAFDLEHAFGGPGGETFDSNSFIAALAPEAGATGWYTLLFRRLMENDTFRAQFLQRMTLFMDTFLSEERTRAVIDSLENIIAPEMPDHIMRWESPVSMSAWYQHVNMLKEFAAQRNSWMYRHMLEYFNLSDTSEVSVRATMGGNVVVASTRIIKDTMASFTVFRDLPLQLSAFPDPGYRFAGWSNGITDQEYQLMVEGDTLLTAHFEQQNSYMLPDTVHHTLIVEDHSEPWVAAGNVIIPEGDTLIISEGTRVQLPPGASLINYGTLLVTGSAEHPVVFEIHPQPSGAYPQPSGAYAHTSGTHSTSGKERWGGIISHDADTTLLLHTELRNASSGMDYGNFRAAITSVRSGMHLKGVAISGVVHPVYAYKSRVVIDSCTFSSSGTGDLINLRACEDAVIRGCDLKGNFYEDTDGIDLDSVSGALVEHNLVYSFFGSNSDGIDMGEHSTGIVIRGNTIKSISDKGISVGQGSVIVAEQNLIIDCNQGFGIKDFQSYAYINQNTLYANRTGIAVFEKNTGNGGGAAQVENTILAGSIETSVFVDDLSTLTVSYSLSDRDSLQGYNNLYGEPGFSGAPTFDFLLSDTSPCINAGTPNQVDPDGTRADIGAFHAAGQPASHSVIITEVNYNSHRAFDSGDWVELHNTGNAGIDLSGWILKGQAYGEEFVFGEGAFMAPGGYMVAARSKESIHEYYPGGSDVAGDMAFGLSNEGELIRLYDNAYRLVYALQYGTGHPWPDGPNGKGASLERFPGRTGENGPGPWHASYLPGGTPGMENSTPEQMEGLYINELMAKNDRALPDEHGQFDDWLEIYNSNSNAVDLGGLHFMYGEEGQRMTMVPYFSGDTTVVEAGGFKLFWADKDPGQGALHLDFNLPAGGGGVGIGQVLENDAEVTDWLNYGALAADIAFGRYPDGSTLLANLTMTPGAPNVLLGSAPPGIPRPEWQIWPNPAKEYIRVDLREVRKPGKILFYAISGSLVRSVLPEKGGQMLINVSDLDPGIYMVRMQGTNLSEKLLVH